MCWKRRPSARRGASCWCRDRKSTRLNSSHLVISYAVFCLKKKTNLTPHIHPAGFHNGNLLPTHKTHINMIAPRPGTYLILHAVLYDIFTSCKQTAYTLTIL